ncbi:mCG128434, partial [Mus musculus]
FVGSVLLEARTPSMSSLLLKMPTLEKRMPLSPSFRETWRRGDALSHLDTLETNKRKALQLLPKDSDKVKEFFEKLQHTLGQKKNEILSDFETMKLAVMQTCDPEINKINTILQEQRMAFNIAEAFKDVSEPIIFLQQMQEFKEKIRVIKETPLPHSNLPTSPFNEEEL